MQTKSYTTHALVMLGFTLALGTFAFALVAHHRSMPERVQDLHALRAVAAQP